MAVGAVSVAVVLLALGVIRSTKQLTYYSPYQVITLQFPTSQTPSKTVPSIRVNHCYYQDIIDGSPGAAARSSLWLAAATVANLPRWPAICRLRRPGPARRYLS